MGSLLLLLLLEMYVEPISITTTIIRNIKKAYYYYYYFPDYSYYYYFPITIIFIITVEPKDVHILRYKHIYILWLHKSCIIKLSWKFCGVIVQ